MGLCNYVPKMAVACDADIHWFLHDLSNYRSRENKSVYTPQPAVPATRHLESQGQEVWIRGNRAIGAQSRRLSTGARYGLILVALL